MKTLVLFLFLSFSCFSQIKDTNQTVNSHIKEGLFLTTYSILPYFISYQTFNSSLTQKTKNLYGGIWFSFGMGLDISAAHHFVMAYKKNRRKKL